MENDARIAELSKRWDQVNRLLDDLAAGRALPENADPAAREQELRASSTASSTKSGSSSSSGTAASVNPDKTKTFDLTPLRAIAHP